MNSILASIVSVSNLISFAVGILTGIAAILLIFVILITKGKKESKKKYSPKMSKLDDDTVSRMIEKKHMDFITEIDENDADFLKTISQMTLDLLHEISSYYYPDSKYPEYELTVEEAADLIHYIVNQFMDWLDRPLFKGIGLKGMKISTIYSSIDKYNKAKKNKIVKAVKGDNTKTAWQILRSAANIINPVYWTKKLVVDSSIHLALKKLCKAELYIAGKEFDKVYSKRLFEPSENTETTKQIESNEIEEIFNDEGDN